jgi:hypothetical protein
MLPTRTPIKHKDFVFEGVSGTSLYIAMPRTQTYFDPHPDFPCKDLLHISLDFGFLPYSVRQIVYTSEV